MSPSEQPSQDPETTPHEQAREEVRELEGQDEAPSDPRDWPSGKASYITFGAEEDEAYGEGVTSKLGPAEVKHHEDGSVTVGGEEVDDPSEFKGEPIKGGVIEQVEQHAQRTRELREQEDTDGGKG